MKCRIFGDDNDQNWLNHFSDFIGKKRAYNNGQKLTLSDDRYIKLKKQVTLFNNKVQGPAIRIETLEE